MGDPDGAKARPGSADREHHEYVAEDLVLRLLDGSYLVLTGDGASPRVIEELATWALVPERAVADERLGDPSVWSDALQAGSLLLVAFQGIIGNAAWSVFPAAARYLTAAHARKHGLDAGTAARAARSCVAALTGEGVGHEATQHAPQPA